MGIEEALETIKSDTNVRFSDLLKICERFFEGPKIKGSHHIFKTPWKGQPWVNLQKDGSKAKSYQVKQVREALSKLKEMQEKK